MEWQYLQYVVKDYKLFFSPIKDALFTDFLDALFSTSLPYCSLQSFGCSPYEIFWPGSF